MALDDKTLKALRNGITIAAFSAAMESEEAAINRFPQDTIKLEDKNIVMPRDNTNINNKSELQLDPKAFMQQQNRGNPMNEGRDFRIRPVDQIIENQTTKTDSSNTPQITEEEIINRRSFMAEHLEAPEINMEIPTRNQPPVMEETNLSIKQEMLEEGEAFIQSYEEFHTEMHKNYVYAKHGIDTESNDFRPIDNKQDLMQFINDNIHNKNEAFVKRLQAEKEILEFNPKGKEIDFNKYNKYLDLKDLDKIEEYDADLESGRAAFLATDVGNMTEDMKNLGDKSEKYIDYVLANSENMADPKVQKQVRSLNKMINKDARKLLKKTDANKKFLGKVQEQADNGNEGEAMMMIMNKAYKNALKNRDPQRMQGIGEIKRNTESKNNLNSASYQLLQQRSGR